MATAGLRPGIASISLGRAPAGHDILHKIEEAALHDFDGIEIFYECLETHARGLPGGLSDANLLLAAERVRAGCDKFGIDVICLQPFGFYDGLVDRSAHAAAIEKLKFWFKLVKILRTDLIQVPSTWLITGTTGDIDAIVADMREIAELGLKESPVVRFAYEAVCWGTHIDLWEQTWDVVKLIDLPNLGICLDTFHIVGRVWADPASSTGENADADAALAASMDKLAVEVDLAKVFYFQTADGERYDPPLNKDHKYYDAAQLPRMTWSRNSRLFPYETSLGAYLPIQLVIDTVIKRMGYTGWVSAELFNIGHYDKDPNVPAEYAARGQTSWEKLIENLGL
ncbi:xylose isomerase-like protein [Limtongia smithiae]|uniref:xylose isomerase-like protein n=1 Tax=Limtongia smithiae TaxID=1125753 RepID=UPI0034CE4C22